MVFCESQHYLGNAVFSSQVKRRFLECLTLYRHHLDQSIIPRHFLFLFWNQLRFISQCLQSKNCVNKCTEKLSHELIQGSIAFVHWAGMETYCLPPFASFYFCLIGHLYNDGSDTGATEFWMVLSNELPGLGRKKLRFKQIKSHCLAFQYQHIWTNLSSHEYQLDRIFWCMILTSSVMGSELDELTINYGDFLLPHSMRTKWHTSRPEPGLT